MLEEEENPKESEGEKSNGDNNCIRGTRNDLQKLGKDVGRIGNRSITQVHTYIIKFGQNTGKSPGITRSQTPVKDHQVMLVWKTC